LERGPPLLKNIFAFEIVIKCGEGVGITWCGLTLQLGGGGGGGGMSDKLEPLEQDAVEKKRRRNSCPGGENSMFRLEGGLSVKERGAPFLLPWEKKKRDSISSG